jgi:hypothetical protein
VSAHATPYWVLISVLFSSFPLEQGLALALYRVALDLHETGDSTGLIDHELAHGQVKNLRKEAVIGSLCGPVFEAELETERGAGLVRFMLTREGLRLMSDQDAGKTPPYLN